jgi:hypothetical protein
MESWSHPSRTSPILSLMTAAEQLQASLSFFLCFDKSAHCHYHSIPTWFGNQHPHIPFSYRIAMTERVQYLRTSLSLRPTLRFSRMAAHSIHAECRSTLAI